MLPEFPDHSLNALSAALPFCVLCSYGECVVFSVHVSSSDSVQCFSSASSKHWCLVQDKRFLVIVISTSESVGLKYRHYISYNNVYLNTSRTHSALWLGIWTIYVCCFLPCSYLAVSDDLFSCGSLSLSSSCFCSLCGNLAAKYLCKCIHTVLQHETYLWVDVMSYPDPRILSRKCLN